MDGALGDILQELREVRDQGLSPCKHQLPLTHLSTNCHSHR